jgi:CheY-like chemotaxis protein
VRLYLPRARGEAKPERTVHDLARAQSGSATILVVEDDEDVREMIIEVVSHLGYRVLAATDGREALSVLEEDATVDLLFSDVVMPSGLSGIELGRGARRLRPELSVLLSSGYVGEAARSELVRSGFSFIAKPYRPTELAAKLSECLRAHAAATG